MQKWLRASLVADSCGLKNHDGDKIPSWEEELLRGPASLEQWTRPVLVLTIVHQYHSVGAVQPP